MRDSSWVQEYMRGRRWEKIWERERTTLHGSFVIFWSQNSQRASTISLSICISCSFEIHASTSITCLFLIPCTHSHTQYKAHLKRLAQPIRVYHHLTKMNWVESMRGGRKKFYPSNIMGIMDYDSRLTIYRNGQHDEKI